MNPSLLHCKRALLPDGWADNVLLQLSPEGVITSLSSDHTPGETSDAVSLECVVPGMPNCHSHAFQRAMAGLTEYRSGDSDNFWTWRDAMYRLAENLTPDEVHAVAAQLYVEMLKAGYTTVAEFHYLHHRPDGAAYSPATRLSDTVIQAAIDTGIGITHLPVLYMQGGFERQPLRKEQQRFSHTVSGYSDMVSALTEKWHSRSEVTVGIAIHSLRAVPPGALEQTLAYRDACMRNCPFHLHIAEQTLEVEQCLQWSGKRPVQWLLDTCPVDAHWCLVHATHLDTNELRSLAASGATAGLCPSTEANLGDGFFPLERYLARGGYFAIGSDSNVSVCPREELRWLEYGQRLVNQRRNLAAAGTAAHTGDTLFNAALAGGARALGKPVGKLAPGYRADLLVIDTDNASMAETPPKQILDTLVFSGNTPVFRDVMVAGTWVVKDYRHADEAQIKRRYHEAARRLRSIAR